MTSDYRTNVVRQLILLKFFGGVISKTSTHISILTNGLSYYFVEVTHKEGRKYIIEAYGEEALELQKYVINTKNQLEIVIKVKN